MAQQIVEPGVGRHAARTAGSSARVVAALVVALHLIVTTASWAPAAEVAGATTADTGPAASVVTEAAAHTDPDVDVDASDADASDADTAEVDAGGVDAGGVDAADEDAAAADSEAPAPAPQEGPAVDAPRSGGQGLAGVGPVVPLAEEDAGFVVAWGNDADGQTDVPEGLIGVVQVAAGDAFAVALRADGTVVSWGRDEWGQTNVPAGLSDVVQVAAGDHHVLALRADGTVVSWGKSTSGQTDVPAELSDAVQVAGGGGFSLALRADGTVVGWGDDALGALDVPPGLTDVVQVAGGTGHVVALHADGTVVAWGDGHDASVPAGLTDVVQVAAGDHHDLALRTDGTVVAWSRDGSDATGTGVPDDLSGAVQVVAGLAHGAALRTDGTVVTWGSTGAAAPDALSGVLQLGAGRADDFIVAIVTQAVEILSPNGAAAVSATPLVSGRGHPRATVTVSVDGEPVGSTEVNADGGWLFRVPPGMTYGVEHTLTARQDLDESTAEVTLGVSGHSLVGWGAPGWAALDVPEALRGRVVTDVSTGWIGSTFAQTVDGEVIAWGTGASVPDEVAAGPVVQIESNSFHALALMADGTVIAWGSNDRGESDVPAELAGRRVVQIATGATTSYALTATGQVIAWGSNSLGQATVPPELDGVTVTWIEGGSETGYAVDLPGRLHGFGRKTEPPSELEGKRVTTVKAMGSGAVLLTEDGHVYGWSDGSTDGLMIEQLPEELADHTVVSIGAGFASGIALTAEGRIVTWGLSFNEAPDLGGRIATAVEGGWLAGFALVDEVRITTPVPGQNLPRRAEVSGTGEVGSQVAVTVSVAGGEPVTVGTTQVDAQGVWTLSPTGLLPTGELTLTARKPSGATHAIAVVVVEPPAAHLEVAARVRLVDRLPDR